MSQDLRGHANASRVRHRVARGTPSYRAVRSPLVSMGPSLLEEQRRHRTWRRGLLMTMAAVVGVAGLVWLVVLLGNQVGSLEDAATTQATRAPTLPIGRPEPLALALVPSEGLEQPLRLKLPVRRVGVTAIGYSRRSDRDLLPLDPEGSRANPAFSQRLLGRFLATEQPSGLRWYELTEESEHNEVVVGAAEGTDVYAPVDGTVVAIADNLVRGERQGHVIQLQPLGDAETAVIVRGIEALRTNGDGEDLAVGRTVSVGSTLLGHVKGLPDESESALARFSHDAGAGVKVYVRRLQPEAL